MDDFASKPPGRIINEVAEKGQSNPVATFDRIALLQEGSAKAKDALPYERTRFKEIEIIPSDQYDPHEPTIAFLDDFRYADNVMRPNGPDSSPIGHGEESARPAETFGYNVLRLDCSVPKDLRPVVGDVPLSADMVTLADAVDDHSLRLGPGDAVNVSLAERDLSLTLENASHLFGLDATPITEENLFERKDEILAAVEHRVSDPSLSKGDQQILSKILTTNNAIKRIQGHGVSVVHAAGNNVNTEFGFDFLMAEHVVAVKDGSGKTDDWSDIGTEAHYGDWEYKYVLNKGLSKMSTPGEDGFYQMAGARFEKGPNDKWFNGPQMHISPDPNELTMDISHDHFVTKSVDPKNLPPEAFSPELNKIFTDGASIGLKSVGIEGTSYANILFFMHHYEEFKTRKEASTHQ